MQVVSIDPGNHLGYAIKDLTNDSYQVGMLHEDLETSFLLFKPPTICVVMETFYTSGNISSYGIYTIEVIGGIKALCWHYHIPVIMHAPQRRRPYIARARAWCKQNRAKHIEHEMDALAHLYCYEAEDVAGAKVKPGKPSELLARLYTP